MNQSLEGILLLLESFLSLCEYLQLWPKPQRTEDVFCHLFVCSIIDKLIDTVKLANFEHLLFMMNFSFLKKC